MRETVANAERIEALDVVRGLAILGILPVNAAFFAMPVESALNPSLAPQPVTESSVWAWAVMHIGFEAKMVTLFSLLFGVSLFLVGGERSDLDKGAALRRRLSWLAVFGLVHGVLIWFGDILFTYAIAGCLVLFARSWGGTRLIVTGLALVGLAVAAQGLMSWGLEAMGEAERADVAATMWDPGSQELARANFAMRDGLVSATLENASVWSDYLWLLALYLPRTIGVMMVGLGLFKLGFFSGRWAISSYVLVIAVGAVALSGVTWHAIEAIRAGIPFLALFGLGSLWNFVGSVAIALGYAAVLIVLVKAGALSAVTGALANCGRMAFTNYLTQSLIMTTIFWSGRGFGLFGEIDRVGLWGIVVAIWIVQLIWSALWLKPFAMGPIEWVWRSLTAGRAVALRRAA
jgi:uncharacterized protein